MAPETTEGRQGFIHPVGVTGSMADTKLSFIIRDFETAGLAAKEAVLEAITKEVIAAYPGSSYKFTVREQYRNMKEILDRNPEIIENAKCRC